MSWFKIAAIAGGIIIAFLIVGSVVHFILAAVTTMVIAALVVGGIAIAIKMARSGKQISRKRDEREVRDHDTTSRCRVPTSSGTRSRSRRAPRRARTTSTTNWPGSSAKWVISASSSR